MQSRTEPETCINPHPTFAACGPVVGPSGWTIATGPSTIRVLALALAVTTTVVLRALVNIYGADKAHKYGYKPTYKRGQCA